MKQTSIGKLSIDKPLRICYNSKYYLKGYIMKEKLKDLGYGVGVIGGLFLTVYLLILLGEFVGMADDSIRIALSVPFFLWFTYLFGGLTRSILNRSK